MKKLAGLFLKLAAILSLILGVTAAAIWFAAPIDLYRSDWTYFGVSQGSVEFTHTALADRTGLWYRPSTGWSLLGLRYSHAPGVDAGNSLMRMHFPLWMIISASLVIPTAGWYARHVASNRRRRRRLANQCLQCDYDLRATRERCPECGMVAKPQHAKG